MTLLTILKYTVSSNTSIFICDNSTYTNIAIILVYYED